MKRILASFSLLFVTGIFVAQILPPNENYVESRAYLEAVPATSSTAKQVHTVQYFDGLGRPKQVVNVKGSPAQNDVVVPVEYDQWGRQVKDYLPVPQAGTQNGQIYTSPLANAAAIYGPEKIYAEKILEASPLNRVLQQKQVGNAWSNHPVVFSYSANSAAEVKRYFAATSWVNNATKDSLVISGNYDANQLYKNSVTDEDGNVSVDFKNVQGQTLLVRKHDGSQNVDTYYVYNEYDQLAFVISPLAAAKASLTDADLNELCYQYRYDGRNRLVEKKLPGKGWEYMVYDKADRLILTQDANLQQLGKWLITKYDQLGRVAYTGILPGGSRTTMQDQITSQVITESRTTAGFAKNGMRVYYTNGYFINIETLLSVSYYDTYPTGTPAAPGLILDQPVLTDNAQNSNISTRSLPTASYVKNIEDDNWTKTYSWYDTKGRPIGSHSINHLGGYTKAESELDFAGTVKQAKTFHKRLDADSETVITENFEYDHQNRLLSQTHQVNSNTPETLAVNTYNELSQLDQKVVGGTLQTIDYTYNIRGWMTGINDPANLGTKLFGYQIKYTNPVYTSLTAGKYNGNIAEIDWITANDYILKRYSYQYDSLHRLQKGIFTMPDASVPQNNFYNEQLTYDQNGNIRTLQRFSKPYNGTIAEKIDDLVYNYTANKLDKITLPAGVLNNFTGYNALGNTILYDSNGNMTKHLDKSINTITYNHLNLPVFMDATTDLGMGLKEGPKIEYKYTADGTKIYKRVDNISPYAQNFTSSEYLNGFQYYRNFSAMFGAVSDTGIQLEFLPTGEGYFDFQSNRYVYQYKDHLGNIRLSYYNDNNVAKIDKETNYYPFGLEFYDYNGTYSQNFAYQYKYNGKELQETGMYDYGARMYMPDIGRWGVVDPLAEKDRRWTPYRYGYNNPLRYIDPDGRREDIIDIEKNTGQITVTQARGEDVVRIVDKGKTQSQYTYGKNGSFTKNNTIIRGKTYDGKGGTTPVTSIVSTNVTKTEQFYKFASKAKVEFSFTNYLNSGTGKNVAVVASSHQNATERFGGEIKGKMLTNKNYSVAKESHSHPGNTPYPSTSDKADVDWNRTYYPSRTPIENNIYIPSEDKEIQYDEK